MAKYLDLDGLAYYKSKEDLLLANKVDKETGKGLSTNDYTTAEKTKLSGIETAAEVNVLEGVQLNGTTITPTNKIANIEIDVPTKTSDLTNDSGFITSSALGGYVPTSRTINSKALTNNITLSASDVGALSTSTTYVSSVNGSSGAITGIQTTSNLSTSIDETSTDTEYPSAKVVYDSQVEQNEKIEELERYKTIYNVLPKVEDEGEALTLNDTGNATLKIDLKGNTTQEGTPTPDAQIEVETATGNQEIEVRGKNLINDYDLINRYNIDSVSGNIITTKAISSNYSVFQPRTKTQKIDLVENTKYYVSFDCRLKSGTYSAKLGASIINGIDGTSYSTGNTAISNPNISRSYQRYSFECISNITTNSVLAISIQVQSGLSNAVFEIKNIMMSTSNNNSYEPYQSQTYPINLGDIELCKIGNYQDRIYKDNGKWYKYSAIGKIVLKGSGNTVLYGDGGTATDYWEYFRANLIAGVGTAITVFSNYFNQTTNSRVVIINNGTLYLRFPKASGIDVSTNSLLNTWLSTHNTEVYYILATPTTTEITDTELINQLNALENARSYTGQTNISQQNDNEPFILNAIALYDLNNLVTRVAVLEIE